MVPWSHVGRICACLVNIGWIDHLPFLWVRCQYQVMDIFNVLMHYVVRNQLGLVVTVYFKKVRQVLEWFCPVQGINVGDIYCVRVRDLNLSCCCSF